ncbi:RipA family octameric membrane protein [Mucilaginibacter psychrotolerans]|uniref:Uncharacterized protein n=1 Tax=Mucilaginibacter psychrotolerans TaxID=1524096 RepID=A0A4Y8SNB8_9SPHI|nr:hypothetical protein [Mucilaginibacter psychrotolerans]TFF40613.1 hypothetical protein E2R66_00045 [Mucilaginibacter psychrotolerans]
MKINWAKDFFIKIFGTFYLKQIDYTPLSDAEYYKRFGIKIEDVGKPVENEKLLERAYLKAWENRDFEINKLWTRAAYFWGFIVLIFGAYFSLLTSAHPEKAIKLHLDLYLLLLGLLFSITWYLVLLGSKVWQQNWEAHVDRLENYISGPIYKTVYYSGRRFYSVSKLNEVIALTVTGVWIALLIQYAQNYELIKSREGFSQIDWYVSISSLIAFVIAIVLRFGYSSGDYRVSGKGFFDRWE